VDDLPVVPILSPFPVDVQRHMVVVGHHRIGEDIDGEDRGQCLHAILNPPPAMFIAMPAVGIFTAEKGATHAARDAMVVGGGLQRDEALPWLGHDVDP
jgi:hypothetical protein